MSLHESIVVEMLVLSENKQLQDTRFEIEVANLTPENPICHLFKTRVANSCYLAILL